MSRQIVGYDVIRSIAILVVFVGHIQGKHLNNDFVSLAIQTLSPGLTMSLLGFISGVLVSQNIGDQETFLLKRLTRIYVSLITCLSCVLVIHWFMGKNILTQHTLLHLMGLTGFFELLLVQNKSTVGDGLWFITVICAMYLLLPLLAVTFRHRFGLIHLICVIGACMIANYVMYGTQSAWNVALCFSLGVFLRVNGYLDKIEQNERFAQPALFSFGLLAICALATAKFIPYGTRVLLFPLYPLAFVPLCFSLSASMPVPLIAIVSFFSSLSYEFYILHFYFINQHFYEFFPASLGLSYHIAFSFLITLSLSYVLSRAAQHIRLVAIRYFNRANNP